MYEILESSSSEWNKYLRDFSLEHQDIYFTSEYYQLCEANGDGLAKLFYFEDEMGNKGFYPFLINRIKNDSLKGEYFDIETAYGYGGPIYDCSNSSSFPEVFERVFLDYCKRNSIIAEFIRFHPLIKNENIFRNEIDVIKNRTTVSVNLKRELEEIWMVELKGENRTRIRKALKNELYIDMDKNYKKFKLVYEQTMKKVNARGEYLFTDAYYEKLIAMDETYQINIYKDNKLIASGCFLKFDNYFHYHLGGSLNEYLNLCPNNFMMWKAIEIGKNLGCQILHLGGGLTDDANDSLFRFKKSFSKSFNSFFIGKRVHNLEIYEVLIKNWEMKNQKTAKLFLQYKY